ncbi:MAG: hypothetical protein K0U09_06435 [Proteobacteria bacterium]|nr:hypothetical protein [Pseudomonadota bacterium]
MSYYPDGDKQLEQLFIDGELDGLHRTWYENTIGNIVGTPYFLNCSHRKLLSTARKTARIFIEVKVLYERA